MTRRRPDGRLGAALPCLVMLSGVAAWLWPIGLGGRMIVGGDATQFSMGLMAVLRDANRSGRLPFWNDLWGYGFPGLAESQMGVYYPPHFILYRQIPVEVAYVASLVLHTFWGALGASWAAWRFGASAAGGAVAGFAWATCGFFLIHLPHQWGYTAGSWMPWAWGLAWSVLKGEGRPRRAACLLAAVLAVQVLPGHFQLAFTTEVGVLVLALAAARGAARRAVMVGLAVLAMVPLAACQLGPTYQLAQLSGGDRDFEYLSGFAASPLHLISYVAPALFHRSPLWRPIAWDPFHTAPEEHLATIGLVPLFLAVGAARRGFRGDPAVRALAIVAAVATLLSLGPYASGFRALIHLPGFSFFRAPARWGLASALALALLAGRGFDAWRAWLRPGRALARFALASAGSIVAVVLVFELALIAARPGADPRLARGFDRALQALPWAGDPKEPDLAALAAEAYRPQADARVRAALARQRVRPASGPAPTWKAERFAIYRQELAGTAVLLVALLAVAAALPGRPRAFAAALVLLAFLEALAQARYRPLDFGPIRPLAAQSPVLARLADAPRGTVTLDPARNLFQVAGVAPAWSYRTLDLPKPDALLARAERGRSAEALRASGVGVRVLGPFDRSDPSAMPPDAWIDPARTETIRDPALAGWLYGDDLARSLRAEDFTLLHSRDEPARAWLIRPGSMAADDPGGATLADLLREATPLPSRMVTPGRLEVEVKVAEPAEATFVMVAMTYDHNWRARWAGSHGGSVLSSVGQAPGGWMVVQLRSAEPGTGTLHLLYDESTARKGFLVSAVAWAAWLVLILWPRMQPGPITAGGGDA